MNHQEEMSNQKILAYEDAIRIVRRYQEWLDGEKDVDAFRMSKMLSQIHIELVLMMERARREG